MVLVLACFLFVACACELQPSSRPHLKTKIYPVVAKADDVYTNLPTDDLKKRFRQAFFLHNKDLNKTITRQIKVNSYKKEMVAPLKGWTQGGDRGQVHYFNGKLLVNRMYLPP